jgi:hypothetical protein
MQRAVELLQERRRRRAEASGQPFQEPLPLNATTPGRRLSVAETLRRRRQLRPSAPESTSK